jgi:hypothetical protein
VGLNGLVELCEVDEAALLGEVKRVLERAAAEPAGQVDEGPDRRGDRDPAVRRRVVRCEGGAPVEVDPSAARASRITGTVTWMAADPAARSSHAAAALPWLSTASRPAARTAAIHRPSKVSTRWPTA